MVYLLPSFLTDESTTMDYIPSNISIINKLNTFVVEDTRTARRFIKKVCPSKDISTCVFYNLNEHSTAAEIADLESILLIGDIGILSDAGCPCIADPGNALVRMAHTKNIPVIPLVGGSSILLALMGSGFSGQNFSFHGYLPKLETDKIKKIREMERDAITKNYTQLCIETPYRNQVLWDSLLQTCQSSTYIGVGINLTSATAFIKTQTVSYWIKNKLILPKEPCIFMVGK